jgi:hypothetical protein
MTTERKVPRQLSLSLAYDMRAPAFGVPAERLYEAALEQCAWADRIGFESVSLNSRRRTTWTNTRRRHFPAETAWESLHLLESDVPPRLSDS